MKINKYNALRFWEECYGSKQYAEDFHGNLMCKDGYGNNNFSVNYYGQEIYCGWNIHHNYDAGRGNECAANCSFQAASEMMM